MRPIVRKSIGVSVLVVLVLLLVLPAAIAGVRWNSAGVRVTDVATQEKDSISTSDGNNGMIVAWADTRYGGTNPLDIYAQHVKSDGTVDTAWPANGVPVSVVASYDQIPEAIISDGAGGAIIAWHDQRLNPNPKEAIYLQRVLSDGTVDSRWTANGVRVTNVTTAGAEEVAPQLVTDNANGAFVFWRAFDGTSTYLVTGQHVKEDGTLDTAYWTAAGTVIGNPAWSPQEVPAAIPSGSNGSIVTFKYANDIYAQKMSSTAGKIWGANGLAICGAADLQDSPALVSDNAGGAIIAWNDYRSGSRYDVYAQHALTGGTVDGTWPANGQVLCAAGIESPAFPRSPVMTTDGAGGAIVAWEDHRTGMEIYASKITNAGAVPWTTNGVQLCTAGSNQEGPKITTDMQGGAIVVWKDTRPPGPSAIVNIYAQRVSNSAIQWGGSALRVCNNNAYQLLHCIVSDGRYGAIVSWDDWRGTSAEDVYVQRVSDDAPVVNSITPDEGLNNATAVNCQIKGANFIGPGTHAKLRMGSGAYVYASSNTLIDSQTLNCTFNLSGLQYGSYDVWLFTDNGQSAKLDNGFTVKTATPVITGIDPETAAPGDQVTITGAGFGDSQGAGTTGGGASYVSFGGVAATEYQEWSDSQIKCTIPQQATSCDVTVVTGSGTSNAQGLTVAYSNWYLAEGSTAWGFDCYISIENPNDGAVTVDVTYNTSNGAESGGTYNLPPMSQTTINPEDKIGEKDFSTTVACKSDDTIAVDRTMTWTGQGAASPEAHCSVGVTAPAATWYLPEGSSEWGFETWLLIQNPGNSEATCSVTYMIEGSDPVTLEKKVPANSRKTYNMKEDIGNKDASIKVVSDKPVIPERAMYRNNRREGHDSIGTITPATNYYLAEGAVGYDSGYITYVLVQNPQNSTNKVTVTYLTGSGEVAGPTIDMPANSRKTIRLNDQLPPATDVSTTVHGEQPIIAERAMYWNSPAGEACHDSIGMSASHTVFYLPDGQTSNGRETWTLVSNPNNEEVQVKVNYLPEGGGTTIDKDEKIPANSRRTFNMADHSGISGRASVYVTTGFGKKIMVERAMYWNNRDAGTDTIGGYND